VIGEPLDYQHYGFFSVISLLSAIPNVVRLEKISSNDWLISDVKNSPSKCGGCIPIYVALTLSGLSGSLLPSNKLTRSENRTPNSTSTTGIHPTSCPAVSQWFTSLSAAGKI
jgi:hypothetical protein